MVALAVDTTGAGRFFERGDWQQSFHKNFEELDEAAELLNRDDQSFVFLAEVLFHELRGLPIHQLALGRIGAALGLGGFRGDFLEACVRIQGRFRSTRRDDMRFARESFRPMLEGPLQDAVDDEVRVAADRRCEMGVLIEA